jgi:hypothetical protein
MIVAGQTPINPLISSISCGDSPVNGNFMLKRIILTIGTMGGRGGRGSPGTPETLNPKIHGDNCACYYDKCK